MIEVNFDHNVYTKSDFHCIINALKCSLTLLLEQLSSLVNMLLGNKYMLQLMHMNIKICANLKFNKYWGLHRL